MAAATGPLASMLTTLMNFVLSLHLLAETGVMLIAGVMLMSGSLLAGVMLMSGSAAAIVRALLLRAGILLMSGIALVVRLRLMQLMPHVRRQLIISPGGMIVGSHGKLPVEVGFGWKDIIGFQMMLMLIPGQLGRMQPTAAAAIGVGMLAFGVQLGATGVKGILQLMTNIVQMQGGHRRKKTKLISLGKMLFLR